MMIHRVLSVRMILMRVSVSENHGLPEPSSGMRTMSHDSWMQCHK
jgi:hypothetical protein